MPENSSPWLVENEVAQRLVLLKKGALFPEGSARGRIDAAHDDVTDFSLGVTVDDLDRFRGRHLPAGRMEILIRQEPDPGVMGAFTGFSLKPPTGQSSRRRIKHSAHSFWIPMNPAAGLASRPSFTRIPLSRIR